MFKLLFLVVFMSLGFNMQVLAQDGGDHTPNVCATSNPSVCAHLGHMTGFSSRTEAQFMAHVMTPQNQPISNVSVDLWMPEMGHGTSPVAITQADINKYMVKNAYFIMAGQWLVRVKFVFAGANYQLNIPVQIAE